ncbi:nucleotidylyl transferase superfamily protein, partial [Striga asiatica]
MAVPVSDNATSGGTPPSATTNPLFNTLSPHTCNRVDTANSFTLSSPSSNASTRAAIPFSLTTASRPASTPARLPSTTAAFSASPSFLPSAATSATSGPTAPAATARSLFGAAVHNLYSAASASFFPRLDPPASSATSGGIAPHAPIESLASSVAARLRRAQAAFCFDASVPIRAFAPPPAAIRVLLPSWRERLSRAVTACSWVSGSGHRSRGIKAGMDPDSPIRTRLSARFFARRRNLAAADLFRAVDVDRRASTQSFTVGWRSSGEMLSIISVENVSLSKNPEHGSGSVSDSVPKLRRWFVSVSGRAARCRSSPEMSLEHADKSLNEREISKISLMSESGEFFEPPDGLTASSPSSRSMTESVRSSETLGELSGAGPDLYMLDRILRMERPKDRVAAAEDGGGYGRVRGHRCVPPEQDLESSNEIMMRN